MGRNTSKLEEKLSIGTDTPVGEFTGKLWQEYEAGRENKSRRLAICMLGYMHSDKTGAHSPRQIETIKDLYTYTKQEIRYGFRCYGKNTWRALNDILKENHLPLVDLPEEYTC